MLCVMLRHHQEDKENMIESFIQEMPEIVSEGYKDKLDWLLDWQEIADQVFAEWQGWCDL